MTLDEGSRRFLAGFLEQHRTEIIESSTDWVIAEAIDLKARRPREETRRLVERVVAGNEAALLQGDLAPLQAFVDFVTSYRAASEFHVSTPLKGMLSFRRALGAILQREAAPPPQIVDLLMEADDVYFAVVFRTADLYEDKLTATLKERRRELEAELLRITLEKTRELEDKIKTIESQRELLSTLSSPVIQIWEGVLLLPIIGEIGADRAGEILPNVLQVIWETRSRLVLVDLTGLTSVDAPAMLHLGRLIRVTRLLGAEVMLVGISAGAARTLVSLDAVEVQARTFATLHDGLRAALEELGFGRVLAT